MDEIKDTVDNVEKVEVVRHLATIQKIVAIEKIEGADRIVCATVLGWKVVTKKDEFVVGDLCVFFEIDSILKKASWNEFLVDKNRPDKPIRLKTCRLKGQISQGLALPISSIPELSSIPNLVEGTDVTEALGIIQYSPDIPAELRGLMKGNFPGFLIKTDVNRVQAYPRVIEELQGVEVYVTKKIDGCCDAETEITTPEGLKTIQELCENKYSGKVLGFNHKDDKFEFVDVEKTWIRSNKKNWYEIALENGQKIKLTGEHRVWCDDLKCYRKVEDLDGSEDLFLNV